MNSNSIKKPAIACFSGNDPTGGAGIQADIETLKHFGCHALPFISCNTIQDSAGIYDIIITETDVLEKQFKLIRQDIPIAAIKIGLLADEKQISFISKLVRSENLPCVIDTVFASGLGTAVSNERFVELFCTELLPTATIATPNFLEAQRIAHCLKLDSNSDPKTLAREISKATQTTILITGTHFQAESKTITHVLALPSENELIEFSNPRLTGNFHGSGCTLASAIAAQLSLGNSITEAVSLANDFTFQSLLNATTQAKHQLFPRR